MMKTVLAALAAWVAMVAAVMVLSTSAGAAGGKGFKRGVVITGTAMPIDGDSLLVEPVDGGKPVNVRLFGISAPEWDMPGGPFATHNLHIWAFGRPVICVEFEKGGHGRSIARCSVPGPDNEPFDLGARMIRDGYATAYRKYLYESDEPGWIRTYLMNETIACGERRGLWAAAPKGLCSAEGDG